MISQRKRNYERARFNLYEPKQFSKLRKLSKLKPFHLSLLYT